MIASPGRGVSRVDLPTRDLPPEGLHPDHLPGQGHGLLPMAGQAGDLIPTLARTRCYRPGSGTLRQMTQRAGGSRVASPTA